MSSRVCLFTFWLGMRNLDRHVRGNFYLTIRDPNFIMSNFKKTPVQTFTKGSAVTSEEQNYWKQLGVSFSEMKSTKVLFTIF